MSNTSSTGGYLTPEAIPSPLEDDGLDDFLQAMVAGITGLPGKMVRPRWQPIPPKQPTPETDWSAIGITTRTPDDNAVVIHRPDGEGADALQRHEEFDALASFYGPNCQQYAGRLRDGLSIAQNREPMQRLGMGLVNVGNIVLLPELLNQRWLRRADLTVRIRRQIDRTYPVLNILSSGGTIHAGDQDTPWNSEN
ncbi:bacteriophage protein [Camelimonas fluminis]|uniref:LIC_12616 family protein n=1 Tax=Camelimonas fluminis TaxID=1576911 RepID=A0ABV7UI61_9HYPH|nr:hypothetical protein [Camelimonas fluminis]GHE70024.1 bacteriophage protein [Camelimonas fluminis]